MNRFSTGVLVCLTVIFVAVLGAYVFLAYRHLDTSGVLTTALTLLAVLGLGSHLTDRLGQQDGVIAQIQKQTNGVLTQKITEGARKAVAEFALLAGLKVPNLPGGEPLPPDSTSAPTAPVGSLPPTPPGPTV